MMLMMRVLAFTRALLLFSSMIIFITGYGLQCIVLRHNKKRALQLRRAWSKFVGNPILNIKTETQGYIPDYPALYVANHRSFADPMILSVFFDALVVAKAEVSKYPIINVGAALTGVIWVNRQNPDSRKDTRSKITEMLQSGFNVLVFPEGTVGVDQGTLPFRFGAFMEAARNNIPVVPVALEYKHPSDLWTLPKFVPQYFRQFSKPVTYTKVHFGPPMLESDGTKLKEKAETWINQTLLSMQSGWSEIFNS